MSGCGCQNSAQASEKAVLTSPGIGMPSLNPPTRLTKSNGDNTMNETRPTLIPSLDSGESQDKTKAGASAPTMTPSSMAGEGGITAWNGDKRVSALWSINQNRNSWVYIANVGWKRLADNSDSAVVALSMLSAHAKQTQTNYSYRDEADGKIHEVYVW